MLECLAWEKEPFIALTGAGFGGNFYGGEKTLPKLALNYFNFDSRLFAGTVSRDCFGNFAAGTPALERRSDGNHP